MTETIIPDPPKQTYGEPGTPEFSGPPGNGEPPPPPTSTSETEGERKFKYISEGTM